MEGYQKQISLSIPLDGLTEVWICGRLVWQDGVVIDRDTLLLLDANDPLLRRRPGPGEHRQALAGGEPDWTV